MKRAHNIARIVMIIGLLVVFENLAVAQNAIINKTMKIKNNVLLIYNHKINKKKYYDKKM
jgi:hypothetical protein